MFAWWPAIGRLKSHLSLPHTPSKQRNPGRRIKNMSISPPDKRAVNISVPQEISEDDTLGPPPPISHAASSFPTPDDPSEDVSIPVPGWPRLATIMTAKADLQAFSSFTDLNIKSLLYYQAELVHLRKQLHKAEWEDYREGNENDPAANYAVNLDYLFTMVAEPDQRTPKQWAIMCKIREVLDKYSKFSTIVCEVYLLNPGHRQCAFTILSDVCIWGGG